MGLPNYFDRANEKEPISTIKQAHVGALVWMKGQVPLSKNKFTHWLLMDYINYAERNDEVVKREKIIVNGKKCEVDMIRKDGTTIIKTRDFAELLGLKVGNKGSVPVIDTKLF